MTDSRQHPAEGPEQEITSNAEQLVEMEAEAQAEPVEGAAETDAEPQHEPAPHLERLQKILAQAGIASRRHAEELITAGRVQVNGQVVTVLGAKADPVRDHIRVDGKLLQGAERHRYFMLNKPKGYVTTVSDPEGRPTVMELFTRLGERLYPVGRLDYLSEGLLLVTNDGDLANRLTRAANSVEKTYLVKVAGQPTEEELDRLRHGVTIAKGRTGPDAVASTSPTGKVRTAPARVRQLRSGNNPWFEVVLTEGRNRELRKMFEEVGHHVEKIRRVGYGPLALDVEPGKTRELDPVEVEALRLTADGKLKPRRLKTTNMLPKEAGISAEEREQKRAAKSGRPYRPGNDRGAKPMWQQGEGRPATPKFTPATPGARRTDFRGPDTRGTGAPRFDRGGAERPRRENAPSHGDFRPRRETGSRPAFNSGSRPQSRPRPGFGAKPQFAAKTKFEANPNFGAKRDFGSRPTGHPTRRIVVEEDLSPRTESGGRIKPDFTRRPDARFEARPGGSSRSGVRPSSGGRPGGFKPRSEGIKPRAEGEGFTEKPGRFKPKSGGFRPGPAGPKRDSKPGGFKPKHEEFKSKPGSFKTKPKAGGFKSKPAGFKSKPGGGGFKSKPKTGGFKPKPGGFKPRSGGKPRGKRS